MRRREVKRHSILGILLFAGVLFFANEFAIAHSDPPSSSSTGIGVSLTLFRDDGTTPVLPGTVTDFETVKVQATLGHGLRPSDAAFEGGTWTITMPDGTIEDVTPPGGFPCIGGTINDPDMPGGRGLCAGSLQYIYSRLVSYTIKPGDVVGGRVTFRTDLTSALAHIRISDLPGVYAGTPLAVPVTPCCNLEVDKKCAVMPPPSEPFVCRDAKPIDSISMIWNGVQTVNIKAWKGTVGSTLLETINGIKQGDEVTVSGYARSPNDVYWEIFDAASDKIGESTFHLSCSDEDMNGPEDCGNPEGDGKGKTGYLNLWKFDGMAGNGLILDCTPTPVEPSDNCSFVAPLPPDCETLGKPKSLTFRYTAAGCSASNNSQASDKWNCIGEPGGDAVSITIVKDVNKITVDKSSVNTNDLVTVSAIGSDMGSEIQLNVGEQFLKIHTSCSQPLAVGDVFGSLELVKFNGQSTGAEVTYSYAVTNTGGTSVDVTSVYDDILGELLDVPFTLGAGDSVTIEKTAMITETTTNTVTIEGVISGTCNAEDSVTVTVVPPPVDFCKMEPGSGKPKILTMTYTGHNCASNCNSQDSGKVIVIGDPDYAQSAYIVATDKSNALVVWFEGLISLGDSFLIGAATAGKTTLNTDTIVRIFPSEAAYLADKSYNNNNYLSSVQFHTSCSQPLMRGDMYGSLELIDFSR